MKVDRVVVVDWSAAGVPTRGKDSIWLGIAAEGSLIAENPATRTDAATRLEAIVAEALARGERLLIAADFAFGAPVGLTRGLTGRDEALALWAWLSDRITDTAANGTNYRAVAAEMNGAFTGDGPFWGDGRRERTPGLPRLKPALPPGLDEHRMAERAGQQAGSRPKAVWQLAGAGAVGAQTLTGIPVLHRLRRAGVAVWPFEDIRDAPVVIAEAYLSLLPAEVRALTDRGMVRDEAEVRAFAEALLRLSDGDGLARLMATDALPASAVLEGWYLGAGDAVALRGAQTAALVPPRLRDDCFAMPQGVAWIPVDTALDRLRSGLAVVTGAEGIALSRAGGRVLAEDVVAGRSNPPVANAAVDGYGFAHAALGTGVQHLPLVAGRAAAGVPFAHRVPAGRAIRILTGAALPDGVDTVVLEEDCATDGAQVAFDGPVKPRANTRAAGEDVVAGAKILSAGHILRAPDLALLAAVGVRSVSVRRRLRVGVLSTGDEIVTRDAAPHQIYDANRPMLLALVAGWGCEAVDLGHVGDDADALRLMLDVATVSGDGVDAILTSGGASAGDEDHVSRLLAAEANLSSWRIAMKPGRPLALATWHGVPVFGLPGNPVAALVCALVFARPACLMLAGAGWREAEGFFVPAGFAKRKKAGRREYLRARMVEGRAEVFASEGSGRISGLSWATGLVELPDGAIEVAPGDPVRFLPFDAFGVG